jgi:tetratricopeptide (TPR) repeat protein
MQFVPPAEAGPRVRAEASKALELDETLPEAHLQLGNTYTWTDWNWSGAERVCRAIELRPNYAEARAFYSHYLYIMRRPAEAQVQIRRALELDLLSEFVQSLSAASLFMARRFDEAEAQLRSALKTNNSPMALTGPSETLHYSVVRRGPRGERTLDGPRRPRDRRALRRGSRSQATPAPCAGRPTRRRSDRNRAAYAGGRGEIRARAGGP